MKSAFLLGDKVLCLVGGEGVGENPVLGDNCAELSGHYAAIAGESHVNS